MVKIYKSHAELWRLWKKKFFPHSKKCPITNIYNKQILLMNIFLEGLSSSQSESEMESEWSLKA